MVFLNLNLSRMRFEPAGPKKTSLKVQWKQGAVGGF